MAYAGNKAAQATTKAANQANASQLQAQREAAALNEPWRQAGIGALGQRNALLGIGGGSASGGAPGQQPGASNWSGYLQANPDVAQAASAALQTPHLRNMGITTPEQWAEYHYNTVGRTEGRQLPTVAGPTGADGQPLTQSQITDQAYNTFLDSGYARSMLETTQNDYAQLVGAFGAGGKSLSGSAIGALNDRNRRNTNNAFTQYDNALAGMSNTGSAISMNQGQQGMQVAGQIGANNMNAANARGSSYMNTAGAINSGLQNTTNALAYGYGQGWFGGGGGGGGAVNLQSGGGKFPNGAPSDIRLKADVEPAGTREGHNWYTYRYVWDEPGTVREGVMAQEVIQTRPDAVITHPLGFLMVDYEMLGLIHAV